MDSDSIIQLIILFILLLLSAFFSSAETALTMVNQIKMKTMADEGSKKAARVLKIVEQPDKMLSAILIGNNIVNLSASSLATTLAIRLLGSMGAGIATGLLTLLILIFGEISPKTMATIKSTELSLRYSGVIWFLMVMFTPVIIIVNALSKGFLKIFGIDALAKDDTITEEELRTMIDVSHKNGEIEGDERAMIHKVFDFSDSTAKEIMIPRIDITMININTSYENLIEIFKENMYTRFPVYENDTDNIIGIVNMKDMLFVEDKAGFSLRDYLREPYFSFELKNTSDLFDEMRQSSIGMSLILDEYGSLSGLVTLEDLLEEIVGEIRDEYDGDEEDDITKVSENSFHVLGSANLEDICEILPLNFESEDYDTIGGYMTGLFDHFPNKGETYVTAEGVLIRILEVDKNRVTRLSIRFPDGALKEETEVSN